MATTLHSALQSLRETKVWKSIFRRGPANTNRTRSLAVFGNLFLHWLPVKVREKSLRVRASYYCGSISFILFIVLFVTGILLMFYYHPAAPHAYRDMKDLGSFVSMASSSQSSSSSRALNGIRRLLAHVSRVLPRGIQAASRVQLGGRCSTSAGHAVPQLHGLSLALGPACLLGRNRWHQHHFRHAIRWQQNWVPAAGREHRRRKTPCCVSTCFTS